MYLYYLMNVNTLLLDLIKIESLSSNEINVCDYIYNLLLKNKFNVKKQFVNKTGYNIIVKIGKPKFYFSAHMDTVKPFLKAYETKDKIYGRGACDTKSSVASMICAAIKAKENNYNNFGLIFTVDEEVSFSGVKKIIEKEKIPFVIVGEPTNNMVVNGNNGILVINLQTFGKKAHSKEPEKGINAIDKMINLLKIIMDNRALLKYNLSITKINGGIADNIIPDFCEVILSYRLSPMEKIDVLKELKKIVKDKGKIIATLDIPAVVTKVPKELEFLKADGIYKGCTELSFYKKGIILGPGTLDYAHQDNEQIKKVELNDAVDIYLRIIKNYQ